MSTGTHSALIIHHTTFPSYPLLITMSSLKKIPTRRLGANGPEVSAIGLGTMGG